MWKTVVVSSVCFLMAACSQQSGTPGSGTAAQNETGTSVEQQKNNIENAADQAQKQVKEAASAQKDKIEAEAKAAKAKIEAEQAEAKAQVQSKEKDLQQASDKIKESVGSAQSAIQGSLSQNNPAQLLDEVKAETKNDPNVQVSVDGSKVTLNGSVDTQAEKDSLEQRIKKINGVQNVDNNLEVKDNNNNNTTK